MSSQITTLSPENRAFSRPVERQTSANHWYPPRGFLLSRMQRPLLPNYLLPTKQGQSLGQTNAAAHKNPQQSPKTRQVRNTKHSPRPNVLTGDLCNRNATLNEGAFHQKSRTQSAEFHIKQDFEFIKQKSDRKLNFEHSQLGRQAKSNYDFTLTCGSKGDASKSYVQDDL